MTKTGRSPLSSRTWRPIFALQNVSIQLAVPPYIGFHQMSRIKIIDVVAGNGDFLRPIDSIDLQAKGQNSYQV